MNILIVTEAFYPDGVGGAHIYVYNLAKDLVKRGHNIYLFTLKMKEDAPDQEKIEGINVFRYNSAPSGRFVFIKRPILSVVNSNRLFNRTVRNVKFDIINFHSSLPAFGLNISLRSFKIFKVFTFHSSIYQEVEVQSKKKKYAPRIIMPLILLAIKLIEYLNFKWANKIVLLSEFSKKQLINLFKVEPEKIKVIPGGVDINAFKPSKNIAIVRDKLNIPKDKVILLTVRRLVARMGLEDLVKAVADIKKHYPDVLLIIGGKGFLKDKLEKLVKEMNLENNILLKGYLNNEELESYYQAADLFILPTVALEGFGIVTLEALSCGLPVMATPVGGSLEILKKLDEKFLFKGTGSKHIAENVMHFISLKSDWEEIRKNCREFVVNNYTWEKVVSEIENLFINK